MSHLERPHCVTEMPQFLSSQGVGTEKRESLALTPLSPTHGRRHGSTFKTRNMHYADEKEVDS